MDREFPKLKHARNEKFKLFCESHADRCDRDFAKLKHTRNQKFKLFRESARRHVRIEISQKLEHTHYQKFKLFKLRENLSEKKLSRKV